MCFSVKDIHESSSDLQALDYYQRAMKSLSSRESHPAVWDSVNWELSTTYFTLATLLQDYAPLSRKAQEQVLFTCCIIVYHHARSSGIKRNGLFQIEREVTEAMMKSLKYCDLQTESARQPLYQYRAATIHHRLASMYHSCFRNQVNTSRSKILHTLKDTQHIRKCATVKLQACCSERLCCFCYLLLIT